MMIHPFFKLPFFGATILAILFGCVSFSAAGAQISRLIDVDSTFVFDSRLRVLFAVDEKRITKKVLREAVRRHLTFEKVHCAEGFSKEASKYMLIHTSIEFPSAKDDISIWSMFLKLIVKTEKSRILKTGWFIHSDKNFWFVDRAMVLENQRVTASQFTFFELDGKVAIILYECESVEMLDQFPIQLAFALHGSELILPIFQRY